jgi:hypothetical protein
VCWQQDNRLPWGKNRSRCEHRRRRKPGLLIDRDGLSGSLLLLLVKQDGAKQQEEGWGLPVSVGNQVNSEQKGSFAALLSSGR